MIRKATLSDAAAVAALAIRMWTDNTPDELTDEFEEILSDDSAAVFVMERDGTAVGFAQCQLRRDYVEGTDSSPVGYLEGIYVLEDYRKQGCAKALLARCEAWAKEMGSSEFASDCELHNETSLAFHLKMGFAEVNRIICFTKKL